MGLQTRTTFRSSGQRFPNWHAASDVAANRRGDAEHTLGLDDEWEDVPTAHLEASEAAATADVDPPEAEAKLPAARAFAKAQSAPPPQKAQPAKSAPAAMPREVTTGTLLSHRYVLGRALGSGGSSLIFQAEDRRRIGAEDFGSRIAIKVLRPELRNNPHALTRLRREFRQMQRLSHPGIATVYELACDEDIWFMTMELIEGETIHQWLKTNANRTTGLQVISACCEALHHAHEAGVVHGDLKPSNVLVLPHGGVKLVDFGSAAERDASMGVIDNERSFAATPPYASPQVLAGEVADPRDDVFSLACLTYAVLTRGEHPFERKSSAEAQQAQMRPAYAAGILPRQFEVLVRALAWDREQRPATVREFMHALLASDLRRDTVTAEAASKPIASTPVPTLEASEPPVAPEAPAVMGFEPHRPVSDAPKPATDVKPEDVARLKAAVVAAEAHAKAVETAAKQKSAHGSKSDPLERFKGYVAGPMAQQGEAHDSTPNAEPPPATPPKKKWTWPWRRSALFGLLLVATAAIVANRAELETEPIQQATARTAAPVAAVPPIAPPPAVEPQPDVITPQVEEKKSPPVAVKPKAAVAPGEVSFTTRTLQIGANQTVAALSVKRLNSTRGRAKVAWSIEEGTARRGVHYEVANTQIMEFLDGQSVRSLFIPLTPDKSAESGRHSKTFTVKLQQAAGGPALGEIKQVYVTIVGDVGDEPFDSATASTSE